MEIYGKLFSLGISKAWNKTEALEVCRLGSNILRYISNHTLASPSTFKDDS